MARKIYHLVEHKILNIMVYFVTRLVLSFHHTHYRHQTHTSCVIISLHSLSPSQHVLCYHFIAHTLTITTHVLCYHFITLTIAITTHVLCYHFIAHTLTIIITVCFITRRHTIVIYGLRYEFSNRISI